MEQERLDVAAALRADVVPQLRAVIGQARRDGSIEGGVWLIGSFAHGEPRPGSDIDLVVDQCADRIGLSASLAVALGRDIHIITRASAHPLIVATLDDRGVPL